MPGEFILTTNDVLVVSHTQFDGSQSQNSELLSRRDYLSIEGRASWVRNSVRSDLYSGKRCSVGSGVTPKGVKYLLCTVFCKPGIFVREAVSHGSFFFQDDVLLSPALANAYELESKYADYPLIVLPESTRRAILKAPKKFNYKRGTDPTPRFFTKHGVNLDGHRRRLEDAYNANELERVRKKYGWLMNYHNRSFRHDLDYVRDQVIDLAKF